MKQQYHGAKLVNIIEIMGRSGKDFDVNMGKNILKNREPRGEGTCLELQRGHVKENKQQCITYYKHRNGGRLGATKYRRCDRGVLKKEKCDVMYVKMDGKQRGHVMIIVLINIEKKRTRGVSMVEKIKWRKWVGQLGVCLELQEAGDLESGRRRDDFVCVGLWGARFQLQALEGKCPVAFIRAIGIDSVGDLSDLQPTRGFHLLFQFWEYPV